MPEVVYDPETQALVDGERGGSSTRTLGEKPELC